MVYYIKVTPEVAKKYANVALRNATKDGNILLWMNDLNSVPGDTLAGRAKYVGGALLTPNESADEYFGKTKNCAYCYTPKYLGGDREETNASESDNSAADSENSGDNNDNINSKEE